MSDLYETCRSLNRALVPISFLWLTWRAVRAWPAEWARPDHLGHYRGLLVLGAGSLIIITWSAYWYIRVEAPATGLSVLSTSAALFTAGICYRWPKPRAMRKDTP